MHDFNNKEFLFEVQYSGFTIAVMVVLYTLFLRMQVGPHSYFFSYSYPEKKRSSRQP